MIDLRRGRAGGSSFSVMMVSGSLASLVTTVIAAGAVLLIVSSAASASLALGGVLAFGFFFIGAGALRMFMQRLDTSVLLLALSIYTVQVMGLLALYRVIETAGWIQGAWLAGGAFLVTLVWQAAQVWALTRTRQLLYDTPAPAEDLQAESAVTGGVR